MDNNLTANSTTKNYKVENFHVNRVTDLVIAKKLVQLAKSAGSRNIHFDLSIGKVRDLLKKKVCYYTGIAFKEGDDDLYIKTIDRLDNTKGYVDDNVVACCKFINEKKGSMTVDDIELIYKGIQKAKLANKI